MILKVESKRVRGSLILTRARLLRWCHFGHTDRDQHDKRSERRHEYVYKKIYFTNSTEFLHELSQISGIKYRFSSWAWLDWCSPAYFKFDKLGRIQFDELDWTAQIWSFFSIQHGRSAAVRHIIQFNELGQTAPVQFSQFFNADFPQELGSSATVRYIFSLTSSVEMVQSTYFPRFFLIKFHS